MPGGHGLLFVAFRPWPVPRVLLLSSTMPHLLIIRHSTMLRLLTARYHAASAYGQFILRSVMNTNFRNCCGESFDSP